MPYPVDRYLSIRAAAAPALSPDGGELAFLTNLTGLPQAWAVGSSGWPRQLTFTTEAVRGIEWTPRGDRLLYIMDHHGNERHQLYLVRPDGSGEQALTQAPESIHLFGDFAPDGTWLSYSANLRDPRFFDLYQLDLATGTTRCLLQHDGANYVGATSPDGSRILFARVHGSFDRELHVLEVTTGETRQLTPDGQTARYEQAQWADDQSVLLLTDLDSEFVYVARLDLADCRVEPVIQRDWDIDYLAVAAGGESLAYTINAGGRSELFVRTTDGERKLEGLPLGVVTGPTFSRDGSTLAFGLDGPCHNSNIWTWRLAEGVVRQATFSDRAGLPDAAFREPDLVAYPTFDGREIAGWWYRPDGSGAWPTIIFLHGGPESQTRASFNPIISYLVDRGYAVLAPNVRGSTGYGKTFHHLDDVRNRMESVADAAAAVDWLVAHGADRERMACFGGSYGGFMVLSLVTTYPDLWAAGVDIVGIANFVTFLEQTGPYRRKQREAEYGSLENDGDFLRDISPINHVDRVKAPLFVLQGATDPRVPQNESDQMVEHLRRRGIPVEYMVFADEGHGLVKLPNRIKAYGAIAEFLDRYMR